MFIPEVLLEQVCSKKIRKGNKSLQLDFIKVNKCFMCKFPIL